MDDGGRARFVDGFTAGWGSGSLDGFLHHCRPLMHPDVRLVHWPLPPTTGIDGFERFAHSVFGLVDGLRGDVTGWEPTAAGVRIDLVLSGSLAGRPVAVRSRDDIRLSEDGLLLRRDADLEHGPLLRAMLRPRAVPRVARAAWALRPTRL